MVRLSLSTLAWLAATAASSTLAQAANSNQTDGHVAGSEQDGGGVVANSILLECESTQVLESLAQEIEGRGGVIRERFDSDFFRGLSAQLGNETGNDMRAEMSKKEGVKGVWPVRTMAAPAEEPAAADSGDVGLGRRDNRDSKAPWNHLMTQVDRLHAAGFTGNGIKIGVVDTGVNYNLPVFGSCAEIGEGCRVAFGAIGAHRNPGGPYKKGHGHGTIVGSILAGYSEKDGFVGVAPNATIGDYRVSTGFTTGKLEEDRLIASWIAAANDHMQVIVSSFGFQGANWAQRPVGLVVSRIVASGVPCIAGIGNESGRGFFNVMNPSAGRDVIAVNSITSNRGLASKSAYGPTPDLEVKPNVIAPGDSVPVAFADGSFGTDSGTSFAGPLVAGIVALIGEARGSFDPALINGLLMSTAVPQGGLYSVAEQGGGLVQAWDAAHATTLVEPASLAFNDTDHRPPSVSLNITNTAETSVTYHLSNIAATTKYTFEEGESRISSNRASAEATASVHLSQDSVTLGPGQSTSISVSASDPEGIAPGRLPVWSGYIKIEAQGSSNTTALTVPYLGVAGSLRSVTPMQPRCVLEQIGRRRGRWNRVSEGTRFIFPDPPSTNITATDVEGLEPSSNAVHSPLFVSYDFTMGTPQLRAYVVPLDVCPEDLIDPRDVAPSQGTGPFDLARACTPASRIVEVDGIRSIGQAAGYPQQYVGRGDENYKIEWGGALASGQYAPPGRYKVAARALAVFGDADNDHDWQSMESPPFSIAYEHSQSAASRADRG